MCSVCMLVQNSLIWIHKIKGLGNSKMFLHCTYHLVNKISVRPNVSRKPKLLIVSAIRFQLNLTTCPNTWALILEYSKFQSIETYITNKFFVYQCNFLYHIKCIFLHIKLLARSVTCFLFYLKILSWIVIRNVHWYNKWISSLSLRYFLTR